MNTALSKRKNVSNNANQRIKSKTTQLKNQSKKDEYIKKKIQKINNALDNDPVDVDLLRKLMVTQYGCITNELRCKVWPKLLNVNIFDKIPKEKDLVELKKFQSNQWWNQVNLDVNRSHRRFAHGTRVSRRKVLQKQLTNIIMRVLCQNEELHYYQGYHDIAVTLLRVVGEELGACLLAQLSKSYIRDFMDKNMLRTNKMLTFFYGILAKVDAELEEFLVRSDVGTIFALSWLITWFGHDVSSFDIIVRLYDVFLSHNPLMPMYVAVELALLHREEILRIECEMPMVHQCLCRLPANMCNENIESIIRDSFELYKKYPPESLKYDIRKYLKESDALIKHAQLLSLSYNQRPDTILRRRKKLGRFLKVETKSIESSHVSTVDSHHQVNPIVKVAVWTMTVSMGVMTFLVLNTSKHWM